jgi:Pyruvate/2-oxoacid:ferredoxin oxidoreductase gamma subunit
MQMRDFVVRFAGEGGQGVVTSAEGLAQASTQVGYYALTYATFPSQIMGGPTWTQARISDAPLLSSGDDVDVLVAFNKEAYDTHAAEVRDGGVIFFNSNDKEFEGFQPEGDARIFGLPIDELARSTGNTRAANMVVMGALAHLVNMPQEYLEQFVESRFRRGRANDEEIIQSNIQALTLGRQETARSGFSLGELAPPIMPEYKQLMLKGNEALCLGAMAAGIEFYVGYPISPATTILVWMERNLVGAPMALGLLPVDLRRTGPALGRAQDDHRPARPPRYAAPPRLALDRRDLVQHRVERIGHQSVHLLRLLPLDKVRPVPEAEEEAFQVVAGDTRQDRRVGDLVAVEVEDRQDDAVGDGVQELVRVPGGGQRSGFRLAIADDTGGDEAGVVEDGAVGVCERVAQLAALVD